MHATNCRALAEQATTPAARQIFVHLAETWEGLAAELDRARELIDAAERALKSTE